MQFRVFSVEHIGESPTFRNFRCCGFVSNSFGRLAYREWRRGLVVKGQTIASLGNRFAFGCICERDFGKCTKETQQRDYLHFCPLTENQSAAYLRFSVIWPLLKRMVALRLHPDAKRCAGRKVSFNPFRIVPEPGGSLGPRKETASSRGGGGRSVGAFLGAVPTGRSSACLQSANPGTVPA